MISGPAPTRHTQADCPRHTLSTHVTRAADGQVKSSRGCLYLPWVPTLPGQLVAHHLTRTAYVQDIGKQPAGAQATCGLPGPCVNGGVRQ